MRRRPQWVAWREKNRSGNSTKVPVNPHTAGYADVSDPATWRTFEEACLAAERHGLPGIGFVLTADTGIVAVDLDNCRNPETGELNRMEELIVARLNSYSEVSPSGCGIHIFVKGKSPGGRQRRKGIEMYGSGRYLTVTGENRGSVSARLEERQDVVNDLHAWIDGDAALVEEAQKRGDPQFSLLWEGKWEEAAYSSQSEADLALCNMLAARTRDPKCLDRIFRWSGLMRDKWDEPRNARHETYGQITITKALAFGSPPEERGVSKNPLVAASAEDFLKRIFPPKEPLLEGLLCKRDLVTLAGRRREGKTSLSMNIAVALAGGMSEFLGYKIPEPRRTLLILLEDDGGEVQEKLRRIVGQKNLGGRLRLLTRDDFLDASVRIDVRETLFKQAIDDATTHHKPDLIIIDNLAHVIAAEYNDPARVHELMEFGYGLAKKHGPAVIFCAHPRKEDAKNPLNLETSSTSFFESVMGSSHFVNSTGSLWGIQRPQGRDYSIFLGGRQRVEGQQSVSHISMDGEGWFQLEDNFTHNLPLIMNTPARVQAWELLPNPPGDFSHGEAQDRVKGVMRSSSTFHRWFTECRRLGVIVARGTKYAKASSGTASLPKSVEVVESDEAA